MVSVHDVCDYLLQICYKHGDYLTNLKLQKLIYYAQAWYLTLYDEALFENDCEAWVHGPVVPEVYYRFAEYKWNPIQYNDKKITLSAQSQHHLEEIWGVFGKFTAYQLEQMTHQELPWIKARGGLPPDEPSNNIIQKEDMKTFYASL